MTVAAFEGPAGTGKTHSLIEQLASEVGERALAPHERVLALTFMHGSRRRLDARLREIEGLEGRFQATTLDSFAWRLCQRWHKLAENLGHAVPAEGDYDATCRLASALLARPVVGSWVAASYPFVVVDEAQDLSAERSMMIRGATARCRVLLAFDEFQCLNPALRPLPIEEWLRDVCEPVRLDRCRRTEDAELLEAARAVRDGLAINRNAQRFKVKITPSKPLAATFLANAIAWRQDRGSVAVLTPSRSHGFADAIVNIVGAGPVGRHRNGPYPIEWESSDEAERNALWQKIAMPAHCSVAEALTRLEPHVRVPAVKSAKEWIGRQRRILGANEVAADDVRRQIDRALAARRRFGGRRAAQFSAMTIQQAKNREFDHVVVVWPYTVPNDDDQKRRLLYNAVTRARRSCLVLVQAQALADAPPFVG